MTQYDSLGHESRTWLPSAGNSTSGSYKDANSITTFSQTTYSGDSHAFSETTYDALSRPVFTSTPGDAWHNAGKGVTTEYTTNPPGSVKRYVMTNTSTCAFTQQGYYGTATLTGEKTTDEDGKTIEIFKDLLGNTVLERRGGNNDTYFLYDKGLLCVVIPPLYQTQPMPNLLYKYKYDDRGRCTEKTLPGCSPISYEYDRYGRIAFIHDGTMPAGTCRFFLYDQLGRQAIQGRCTGKTIGTGYSQVAQAVFGSGDRGITGTGYYISSAYSLTNPTIEIVNYYDGYDFLTLSSLQDSIGNADLGRSSHANATTLLTGRFQKTSDGHYLCSAIYYDQNGNIVETRENVMGGGIHSVQSTYTFTGQPSEVCESLTGKGVSRSTAQYNTYDTSSDLLIGRRYRYNNMASAATASYTYDALGRIDSVGYHGGNLSTRYDYDLHGWITGIHGRSNYQGRSLFDETIRYSDGVMHHLYNGSISSIQIETPDNPAGAGYYYGYSYMYDNLNRMTSADYLYGPAGTIYGSTIGLYSETVGYDANSNISTLTRIGIQNNGYPGDIDNLSYSYYGNQLWGATDQSTDLVSEGAFEFKDNTMAAYEAPEYGYNPNGAMTYDVNKGISWINYDQFGTPRRVQFANHSITEYVYAADGRRLKTRHRTSVPRSDMLGINQTASLPSSETLSVDSTEYIGSYVCTNGQAKRYNFDGGYLMLYNTVATPRYYIKDHLGSNRVVVNSIGTINQHNIYYALGGNTALGSGQEYQQFKYTDKEYDPMHGLNQYDFSARQYDPAIGRFTSVDPLAEKYYHLTPYSYCGGDPVNKVDPDGRYIEVEPFSDYQYRVIGGYANDDLNVYLHYRQVNQEIIGKMLTKYSFMGDDEKPVIGAIIDISDHSGSNFLYNFTHDTPDLLSYILNAKEWEKYDFKRTNGRDIPISGRTEQSEAYMYRGMEITFDGETFITSARDIGNFAAGYIAEKNLISPLATRIAFNALESFQQGKFANEKAPTQYSQFKGYAYGIYTHLYNLLKLPFQFTPNLGRSIR